MKNNILKYLFFTFWVLSFNSIYLKAINAPELYCIKVNTNGSVNLNWSIPTQPGTSFVQYEIWRSNSRTNNYSQLLLITNQATISYLDQSINANTNSYYYYIKYVADGDYKISDTLQSIMLNTNALSWKDCYLNWNDIYEPSSNNQYSIFRKIKYNSGSTSNWSLIGTSSTDDYSDSVIRCRNKVYYKVESSPKNGCSSVSRIDSLYLGDNNPPSAPIIDSITVNSNGEVFIGWEPYLNENISKYHVSVKNQNGDLVELPLTIPGNFTSFEMTDYDPNSESVSLILNAFDSCQSGSLQSNIHSTMFLDFNIDSCEGSVNLNWSPYIGWDVKSYDIYLNTENNGFLKIGTSTSNSFKFDSLISMLNYKFFIRAIDDTSLKTSTSNIIDLTPNIPQKPFILYINKIEIPFENEIKVSFLIDPNADVYSYKIYRSNNPDGPFSYKDELLNPNVLPTNNILTYIDNKKVYSNDEVYYYKIVAINSCLEESLESNVASNVLLRVKVNGDLTNTLEWNTYLGWPSSVSRFKILRKTSNNGNYQAIKSIAANGNEIYSYIDDVEEFANTLGEFNYKILCIEGQQNSYNLSDSVYSNNCLVYQKSKFFMPNAISPSSYSHTNTELRPNFVHSDLTNYSFKVYNRMGECVFETDMVNVAWDGSYLGKPLPMGIYIYYVNFTDNQNRPIEKVGYVTLVR